jgi:hypothetical protein
VIREILRGIVRVELELFVGLPCRICNRALRLVDRMLRNWQHQEIDNNMWISLWIIVRRNEKLPLCLDLVADRDRRSCMISFGMIDENGSMRSATYDSLFDFRC